MNSVYKIYINFGTYILAHGLKCNTYHADLSYKIRENVHRNFVKDILPVVVATVAFGMGIDKPGTAYLIILFLCIIYQVLTKKKINNNVY